MFPSLLPREAAVGSGCLGSGLSPDTKSAGFLILYFSDSRTVRNQCSLFVSHSVYGTKSQQPTWTRILSFQPNQESIPGNDLHAPPHAAHAVPFIQTSLPSPRPLETASAPSGGRRCSLLPSSPCWEALTTMHCDKFFICLIPSLDWELLQGLVTSRVEHQCPLLGRWLISACLGDVLYFLVSL